MPTPVRAPTGSLTIVGAGIRPGLQITQEARVCIERADKVLYLIAEHAPTAWLHRLNASAESMAPMYRPGRRYRDVYEETVTTLLTWVGRGLDVCVVTYGHPGVFDWPTSESVRRARAQGHRTKVLPGISAQDCLFVDLELDPGVDGCQTFDATDFLVRRRTPDVAVPLILWQISLIGTTRATDEVNRPGIRILADRLAELYGTNHEVVVYEASPFPVGRPMVERCPVSSLAESGVTGMSSLYVPPNSKASSDPEMIARLGMSP
jgi:uncharacterized protein YabN with tetrapyrrole methylase and pyrophosphatase domain